MRLKNRSNHCGHPLFLRLCLTVFILGAYVYIHTAYAQQQDFNQYSQYSIEFKNQEKTFVQQLKQTNPNITQPEIKAQLRQFQLENFDPFSASTTNSLINSNISPQSFSSQSAPASTSTFNQVPDDIEYMALRAFFEATDGPNWTNTSGWDYPNWKDPGTVVTQDLNCHGVLVSNGDVITIAPYNNNLSGDVKDIDLTGLEQLQFLQFNNNNMTGNIQDLKLVPSITHVIIYNNNIQGDISGFDLGNTSSLITLDASNNQIGGRIDQFDTKNIAGIYLGLNNIEGEIHQWDLTGNSNIAAIVLSDNNIAGDIQGWNLTNNSNVLQISVAGNAIAGQIHLWDLSGLDGYDPLGYVAAIDVSNNDISGDLNLWTTLGSVPLNALDISNNAFTFQHFLPFAQNTSVSTFSYAPQKNIDIGQTTSLYAIGDILSLESSVDRSTTPASRYQWFKDGQAITTQDPTNHTYNKANFQIADEGDYYYTITNTALPDLTLQSETIMVENGTNPPTLSDVNICTGQSVALSPTGTGTLKWYTDEISGTPFFIGATYTTPNLMETTSYFLSQEVGGIESERVKVTVIVGPIFDATPNQTICRGEFVPISVFGEELAVNWSDGNGDFASFVAQPGETTTYNYTVEDAYGCSGAGSITITVLDPFQAEIITPAPTCLGDNVTLEAEDVPGATYAWEPGGLTGRLVDVTVSGIEEYTVTVTGSNGCTSTASVIPQIKTFTVAGEDREICITETVTLSANGGDTYLWSTGETTQDIEFAPTAAGIFTLTVTATKDGCSSTDDVVVTVDAYCPGEPISFLARAISTTEIELNWREPDGNHNQYVIQKLNDQGTYETVATVPLGTGFWLDDGLEAETVYYYRIFSEVATEKSDNRFARARTFTPNQNYIMETEVLVPGITDVLNVPNLGYQSRNTAWNYLNGLGSEMQTVIEGASPSQKDVIQPIIFDEYGMQTKQYLSYTIAQPTKPGNYRDEPEQEALNFYGTPPPGIASTSTPYAETVFEQSPQAKVSQRASPGEDWAVGTGREIEIDITTNSGSDLLDWQIVGDQLRASGYYPLGELKKTVTTNEDGEVVTMFEDILGRELMHTVALETGSITTYFVYNSRGSLRYRITPNIIENLSGGLPYVIDATTLASSCYTYVYDAQERLIEEKWPDKEAVLYVYDEWDRPVLSQTGNQRLTEQWSFTKYDRFNRPVLSGLYTAPSALTQAQMQAEVDAFYATGGGSRYESYGGTVLGYTNTSFPDVPDEQFYLSATYYDSYSFINDDSSFGPAYAYDPDELVCQNSPQGNFCFPASPLKVLRGKVTGSKTRIVNTGNWLNGVIYYDERGRTVQAIAQNHRGGIDRASSLYSFSGWLLATRRTMNAPDGNVYGIARRFAYDHTGRLLEGYHELFRNGTGQGEVLLAQNIYNELGQLIEKNLHVDQNIPLQSVDYRYNIRGWLESVNNAQLTNDGNDDVNDLFGMEIIYQTPVNGITPGTN